MNRRLKLEIHGAVQGVGFRPFVYRLAHELNLAGWVINDARGVFVELDGPQEALDRFLERLPTERPPRSIIHSLDAEWLEPAGYTRFEIRHSDEQGVRTALILPDIATCPECLAEVFDPHDRRFHYPFTNCTNCGPRLTIIQDLPYDRPHTTMRGFSMCPACQHEYDDPTNRRFHAQPNACPNCGPRIELWQLDESHRPHQVALADQALHATADALHNGEIVAVKGLGGFHIMCDARNAGAVKQLRERKHREAKPFALMARDIEQVRLFCEVPPQAIELLAAPEAPIVLLRRHQTTIIAENVAPGNPYLGVMLPYTPLHHLLLRTLDFPLVATSGNLTDEPICIDEQEAPERLGTIANLFLVHNRPIERHADDSITAIVQNAPRVLRRARGYAPLPVLLREAVPCVLAVGAHLKNTIALSVERQVFISQHIGDLETPQAIAAFERVIADFLRLYATRPAAIAYDLHPDYVSTRFARAMVSSAEIEPPIGVPVQHHHAHLAACLAENNATGPALGVTWDGTGYGMDGTIWGGEFLLGDATAFTRVAHLRPFRLPGGEAAIHEPWRVALALLWELEGPAALEHPQFQAILSSTEQRLLSQMLHKGINAPVTTSAGRLFDGIAALIGLRQKAMFEGQAAMELEWAAGATIYPPYPLDLEPGAPAILDWRPMVVEILADLRRGVGKETIAARFHTTLSDAITRVARMINTHQIALTGGCFLNRLLTEQTARTLEETGFSVLLHRQVPPGDGGISLGQIAVAAAHR